MVNFKAVRGMNDLFEPEISLWQKTENTMKDIFSHYLYEEVRTPILEDLKLFKRGIGEHTDLVEKEMFVIYDGEHEYALRGENTAPLVRALIEKGGIGEDFYKKYFYLGPMFRKERPQRGRLRQFHQFGLEIFGISEAYADIEIMVLVNHLFDSLKLKNITLKINSLGQAHERVIYKSALKNFLSNHKAYLCEDCQRRMEQNTLRVLDCKKTECKEIAKSAPSTIEYLETESLNHFEEVKKGLLNQNVAFEIDNRLVRGLDYYERTVFEFVADIGLGSQNTICGGGRYDGLFQTLGHKNNLPAIGVAGGIERMVILLSQNEENIAGPNLCLIAADDDGFNYIQNLGYSLRNSGIKTDFPLSKKSVKSQMRRADKINSQNILVIGKNEIDNNEAIIKSFYLDKKIPVKLNINSINNALKG